MSSDNILPYMENIHTNPAWELTREIVAGFFEEHPYPISIDDLRKVVMGTLKIEGTPVAEYALDFFHAGENFWELLAEMQDMNSLYELDGISEHDGEPYVMPRSEKIVELRR